MADAEGRWSRDQRPRAGKGPVRAAQGGSALILLGRLPGGGALGAGCR